MKIIGMMSGTSADGVDAALLDFDDQGVKARIASHFEPYTSQERAAILANMGSWNASQSALDAIHAAHNRALKLLPEPEVIGFHGQTLNHNPASRRTFQAGDPAALETSAQVIHDFRTLDVENGGEGAPLVPIYHYALARELGFDEPVEFVNIGGVSNVTYVDPKEPAAQGLLAFDTGVGNAMSDDLMEHFFGKSYDENGTIARSGQADAVWLAEQLENEFFQAAPPKSLDRLSLYSGFDQLKNMKPENAIASVMAFAIAGIERAREFYPQSPTRRILVGGGRRNSFLCDALGGVSIDEFGLDGDMIEAEGFAYLAWAHLRDMPVSFPSTTRAPIPLKAGRNWRRAS